LPRPGDDRVHLGVLRKLFFDDLWNIQQFYIDTFAVVLIYRSESDQRCTSSFGSQSRVGS
jgi:hypothetical protein